ncbi:Transposase family protein OS=Singulisphaera acidiphila (strain ATCC BAA-1392 / DSM 18658 / VKM B-2454 / MOB10) GN=Sinac_4109 PE=4 SV=1 [Gemmata massiliana]|uniref:Transposase family protein n=1 Tax=Gemmata massiliana TaxID=1210884 RepID=A0A6P2CYN5_9BACT|nr:hypothetical protein [Gemmata massiliana]VTR94009.1 Transposase family protein OS=Singulisphaera acidiphila (strain ATCC BAA-1392 / DSM 18658 / VKM B-2454 / MOB10) GN=Sinac_4109 PE=4 SV=1 [Gemmata massiliana]
MWTPKPLRNGSPRLKGPPVGKVVRMCAGTTYHNFALGAWVEDNARWDRVVVPRPEGSPGWVKLPIRWTVERTFTWLGGRTGD